MNFYQSISDYRSPTCFSSKSLLADKHVTRYLVRFRNDPSTSSVRCSREERCSMNDITRKPRFCIICCCTVCEVSTSSQMKPNSFELNVCDKSIIDNWWCLGLFEFLLSQLTTALDPFWYRLCPRVPYPAARRVETAPEYPQSSWGCSVWNAWPQPWHPAKEWGRVIDNSSKIVKNHKILRGTDIFSIIWPLD